MNCLRFYSLTIVGAIVLFVSPCFGQSSFVNPAEAAAALSKAVKESDLQKLHSIFGPDAAKVLSSGDPVQDKRDREVLFVAMEQAQRWAEKKNNSRELIVGHDEWPFPIPLRRVDGGWKFDTAAGAKEILARRIGRNELSAIKLCAVYVQAQLAYAARRRDGKPAGIFAQKFQSSASFHDGLFWHSKPGEEPSPLGDLAAQAEKEEYRREVNPAAPFHGYYFRILTAQGRKASGGSKSYVVNGKMIGGFALIAYPAEYRNSGVMTFIVNQEGVVHEKDLGPDTVKLAGLIKEYNPDSSWREP